MKNAQGARYRLISSVQFVPGSLCKRTGIVGVTILYRFGLLPTRCDAVPTNRCYISLYLKMDFKPDIGNFRITLSQLFAFCLCWVCLYTTNWLEESAITLGLSGRLEAAKEVDSSYCIKQGGYSGLPKMTSVLSGDRALFSSKHVHATNMIVPKPIKARV